MKRYLIWLVILCGALLGVGWFYVAKIPSKNPSQFFSEAADYSQAPFDEVFKAKVDRVLQSEKEKTSHYSQLTESLLVTALEGSDKNKQVNVYLSEFLTDIKSQEIKEGDTIVVGKFSTPQETSYVFVDRYRLPFLIWLGVAFLFLAIIFGGWRGITSIMGLGISIAILIWFVAPNLLAGKNPILVTMVGAGCISLISMFFAHGFKQRTALAVISTLTTLALAQAAAYFSIIGIKLAGGGSEEAFYLQQGLLGNVNLQGLFLGGIIIGTLGILNDITTAQSAAVEEIYGANGSLTFSQLYKKASSVGKEHIASLINTLVLTYVGASMPLFLLILLTSKHQIWTVINSESMAEEIVRTAIGSMALIVAVPITTAFCAYYFIKNRA